MVVGIVLCVLGFLYYFIKIKIDPNFFDSTADF